MSLRGVAFDLDDTLFLENDYVLSGLRAVAAMAARVANLDARSIFDELVGIHMGRNRGHDFDVWLASRPELNSQLDVATLVQAYRDHHPQISFLPGVVDMLAALRQGGLKLALVTDGYASSQKAKIAALGLRPMFDKVIVTDEWGPTFWKPHPRALEFLESEWSLCPTDLAYVGDNPAKDFVGAKGRGWLTIRIRLPGQMWSESEATSPEGCSAIEVNSVDSLLKVLVNGARHPKSNKSA